jgi:fumarylacetoacetate (FAA) hydrolase
LLGAHDDVPFRDESWGIDLEAEVAAITDDVPMATGADAAAAHIKLLVLVNDWSLRGLIPGELAKGFGFYQSKPASSFSPVAVTPDELGAAWRDARVHLPLQSRINGQEFGSPDAVVGSGTVSNYDRSRGSSCLAEKRTLEQLASGAPQTPFLKFGDRVAIEMRDPQGENIFGTLDNKVTRLS